MSPPAVDGPRPFIGVAAPNGEPLAGTLPRWVVDGTSVDSAGDWIVWLGDELVVVELHLPNLLVDILDSLELHKLGIKEVFITEGRVGLPAFELERLPLGFVLLFVHDHSFKQPAQTLNRRR